MKVKLLKKVRRIANKHVRMGKVRMAEGKEVPILWLNGRGYGVSFMMDNYKKYQHDYMRKELERRGLK